MIYHEALFDLLSLHRGGLSKTGWGGNVRMEDVERWARAAELDLTRTFDLVAVGLAQDYAARIFAWEFCDSVANDLRAVLFEFQASQVEFDWPSWFWKFYLAFDESESAPSGADADGMARKKIADLLTSFEFEASR